MAAGEALLSECFPVSNIILFISRGVSFLAPGRSTGGIVIISVCLDYMEVVI